MAKKTSKSVKKTTKIKPAKKVSKSKTVKTKRTTKPKTTKKVTKPKIKSSKKDELSYLQTQVVLLEKRIDELLSKSSA
ncbi:MAG: hypothetical protein MAG458_01389 [Nitrosopumilus sp.]|nr:hypothetical protein [Nitrosopumilus sp.]